MDDFFDKIKIKGNKRGIILEIKEKKELELDIPLPPIFSKVSTDDEEDIGRKLDRGNDLLCKLVYGQNKLVDGQNSILDILKKIENKL